MVKKNWAYNPYAGDPGSGGASKVDTDTIKENTAELKEAFEKLGQNKSQENIKNIEDFINSVYETIGLAGQVEDAKSVKRFKDQLTDLINKANDLIKEIKDISESQVETSNHVLTNSIDNRGAMDQVTESEPQKLENTLSEKLDIFSSFKIDKTTNIEDLQAFINLGEELIKEVSSQKHIDIIKRYVLEAETKIKFLSSKNKVEPNPQHGASESQVEKIDTQEIENEINKFLNGYNKKIGSISINIEELENNKNIASGLLHELNKKIFEADNEHQLRELDKLKTILTQIIEETESMADRLSIKYDLERVQEGTPEVNNDTKSFVEHPVDSKIPELVVEESLAPALELGITSENLVKPKEIKRKRRAGKRPVKKNKLEMNVGKSQDSAPEQKETEEIIERKYNLFDFDKLFQEFHMFSYFNNDNLSELNEYFDKAKKAKDYLIDLLEDNKLRNIKMHDEEKESFQNYLSETDSFLAGVRKRMEELLINKNNPTPDVKEENIPIEENKVPVTNVDVPTQVKERVVETREEQQNKVKLSEKIKSFFNGIFGKPKTEEDKQIKENINSTAKKTVYNMVTSVVGVKAISDWLGAGVAYGLDKISNGKINFAIGKRTDVYKYFEQKSETKEDRKTAEDITVNLAESASHYKNEIYKLYRNPEYVLLVNKTAEYIQKLKEEPDENKKRQIIQEIENFKVQRKEMLTAFKQERNIDTDEVKSKADKYHEMIKQAKTSRYYDLPKTKRDKIDIKINNEKLSPEEKSKINKENLLTDEERSLYLISSHDQMTLRTRLNQALFKNVESKNNIANERGKKIDYILQDYIQGTVSGTSLVKDAINTAIRLVGGAPAGALRGVMYGIFAMHGKLDKSALKYQKEYSWNSIGEKIKMHKYLEDAFRSSFLETYYGLSGKKYESEYVVDKDNKLQRLSGVEKLKGADKKITIIKAWGELFTALGMFSQGANAAITDGSFDSMIGGFRDVSLDNIKDNLYDSVDLVSRAENLGKSLDHLKDIVGGGIHKGYVAIDEGLDNIFHPNSHDVHTDISDINKMHITGADSASGIGDYVSPKILDGSFVHGHFRGDDVININQIKSLNHDQIHELASHGAVVLKGSSVSETLNMNVPQGSKMTLVTFDELGKPTFHENFDANVIAPDARLIEINGKIIAISENSDHASFYEYYEKHPDEVMDHIKLKEHTMTNQASSEDVVSPEIKVETTPEVPIEPVSAEQLIAQNSVGAQDGISEDLVVSSANISDSVMGGSVLSEQSVVTEPLTETYPQGNEIPKISHYEDLENTFKNIDDHVQTKVNIDGQDAFIMKETVNGKPEFYIDDNDEKTPITPITEDHFVKDVIAPINVDVNHDIPIELKTEVPDHFFPKTFFDDMPSEQQETTRGFVNEIKNVEYYNELYPSKMTKEECIKFLVDNYVENNHKDYFENGATKIPISSMYSSSGVDALRGDIAKMMHDANTEQIKNSLDLYHKILNSDTPQQVKDTLIYQMYHGVFPSGLKGSIEINGREILSHDSDGNIFVEGKKFMNPDLVYKNKE